MENNQRTTIPERGKVCIYIDNLYKHDFNVYSLSRIFFSFFSKKKSFKTETSWKNILAVF